MKVETFFKLSNKTLPILDKTIALTGDQAIQTDLENFIISRVDSDKIGVYSLTGLKAGIYDLIDSLDNYPKLPELGDLLNTVEVSCEDIHYAKQFLVKDETRPFKENIFLKDNMLYASDAYRLLFREQNYKVDGYIALSMNIIPILPKTGKLIIEHYKEHAKIYFGKSNENILIHRMIDNKPPDFNSVIPKDNPNKIVFDKNLIDWDKLEYCVSTINKSIKIESDGGNTIFLTSNIDLGREYKQVLNGEVQRTGDLINMGFNIKYIKQVIGDDKECAIEFSTPNRPVIINKDRLLMPTINC